MRPRGSVGGLLALRRGLWNGIPIAPRHTSSYGSAGARAPLLPRWGRRCAHAATTPIFSPLVGSPPAGGGGGKRSLPLRTAEAGPVRHRSLAVDDLQTAITAPQSPRPQRRARARVSFARAAARWCFSLPRRGVFFSSPGPRRSATKCAGCVEATRVVGTIRARAMGRSSLSSCYARARFLFALLFYFALLCSCSLSLSLSPHDTTDKERQERVF